jgi:hypothetical protein
MSIKAVDSTREQTATSQSSEQRRQHLRRYLVEATRTGDTTSNIAAVAWRLWETACAAAGPKLRVPNAGTGPNGEVMFVWNANEHYLELEVFPDQTADFFYENRQTDEAWVEDVHSINALPEPVVKVLQHFTAA